MLHGLELRELRAFLLIAEELHFGRVAERLGVSPSRVSQILQRLETRVGGRLVERSSRSVRLTSLGERLEAEVGPLVASLDEAMERARTETGAAQAVFRVGMSLPSNGGPRFAAITERFRSAPGGCDVEIVNSFGAEPQVSWLDTGRVDMLATRLPVEGLDELVVGPRLSSEPRVAMLAAGDPLAARDSIGRDDLDGRRVIVSSRVEPTLAAAFWPLDTPSGGRLVAVDVPDHGDVALRVALGEVVHLTVPSFYEQHRYPGVVAKMIDDLPPSDTALVWRAEDEGKRHRAFAAAALTVTAD